MTGLLAVPLLGLGALAVDIANLSNAKAALDSAADSAALLATTAASNAYLTGATNIISAAQSAATSRFTAQIGTIPNVTLGPVQVTVSQNGPSFTSSVTYSATVATILAPVLGINSLPLSGASGASISVNPYVDIQILMDVSSSMTIGATTADINTLQTLTAAYVSPTPLPSNVSQGEACGFACHWTTSGPDFYSMAEKAGVQLRIDLLRSAVGNLISTVSGLDAHNDFRIGMYTFGQQFSQIYPVSSSLSGATAALSLIAPDVNDCSSNCPDTYFSSAVSDLAGLTSKSGNGSSQSQSQKFLFIVTDGLVDEYVGSNRVIETVQPTDCNPIKAKGVTILVLYTPYLPLPTNAFYNEYVAPIQANIGPALQSCASSPNYYFQAADSTDINAQLQLMLNTVLQTTGHLTQ